MSKYVELAKRENNNKRKFVIVNPYLGKHVPIMPSEILCMFDKLSMLRPDDIDARHTLVIGFAETATALAIHYAITNKTYFIQTTRETVFNSNNKKRLYFNEEHSHAMEQYIVTDGLDDIINDITNIIFIDDEITTGNTVLNAINAIKNRYNKDFSYSVISILNSMTDEQMNNYKNNNISVYYLEKINSDNYGDIANKFECNGFYHKVADTYNSPICVHNTKTQLKDTRTVTDMSKYAIELDKITDETKYFFKEIISPDINNILILGTEEFMYPGIMLGDYINQNYNIDVKFHATTRSPISVSANDDYPLHERYLFNSVYDKNRVTYLYDLKSYDLVLIITESNYVNIDNFGPLIKAINQKNVKIILL